MFLDFARKLRKLRYMRVTLILNIIGALGIVPKGLEMGQKELKIRRQIKTIQITALLISVRILCGVLETWEDLLWFRLQWNTNS